MIPLFDNPSLVCVWRYFVPIALDNGNTGRGGSWHKSAERRKQFEELLLADRQLERWTPFDAPVFLRITRVYPKGQRAWDCDSILRGSAKELIDALVKCGRFHDDRPKWIAGVYGDQERGDTDCVIFTAYRLGDQK